MTQRNLYCLPLYINFLVCNNETLCPAHVLLSPLFLPFSVTPVSGDIDSYHMATAMAKDSDLAGASV